MESNVTQKDIPYASGYLVSSDDAPNSNLSRKLFRKHGKRSPAFHVGQAGKLHTFDFLQRIRDDFDGSE